jgi:hypothetical protein
MPTIGHRELTPNSETLSDGAGPSIASFGSSALRHARMSFGVANGDLLPTNSGQCEQMGIRVSLGHERWRLRRPLLCSIRSMGVKPFGDGASQRLGILTVIECRGVSAPWHASSATVVAIAMARFLFGHLA